NSAHGTGPVRRPSLLRQEKRAVPRGAALFHALLAKSGTIPSRAERALAAGPRFRATNLLLKGSRLGALPHLPGTRGLAAQILLVRERVRIGLALLLVEEARTLHPLGERREGIVGRWARHCERLVAAHATVRCREGGSCLRRRRRGALRCDRWIKGHRLGRCHLLIAHTRRAIFTAAAAASEGKTRAARKEQRSGSADKLPGKTIVRGGALTCCERRGIRCRLGLA